MNLGVKGLTIATRFYEKCCMTRTLRSRHANKRSGRELRVRYRIGIGHYQNEWETGSESATQRHLGSFGGTGHAEIPSKNATTTIMAVFAARYTAIVLPLHCCLSSLVSCPCKRSQLSAIAVLIRPSSRLVLVMSNSERKIFSLQVVTTVRVSVGNVYTSTKHPAILFRPFPLRLRRLGHHVLCGLSIVACPCPKSYLFLFFFFNFGSNSWKIQRKS